MTSTVYPVCKAPKPSHTNDKMDYQNLDRLGMQVSLVDQIFPK